MRKLALTETQKLIWKIFFESRLLGSAFFVLAIFYFLAIKNHSKQSYDDKKNEFTFNTGKCNHFIDDH